ISNPDLIEPGWKLWIPGAEEAARLMEELTPVSGGTLVVGLATESIDTFDPADYRDRPTETVLRNMFDGLVTRTTTNKVVPQIADSWEWIDNKTLEFKLKQGVTFHNGEPLTAEDVKFTFERTITENAIEYPEPHTAARKGLIAPLEEVEVVDDYTVRLHFSKPWPVALQMLCHHQIVPKDYMEQVGTEGFIAHPIGAGPFKFVEGSLDTQVVMERFNNYYGGSKNLPPVGLPYLKRVIFRMLPEASTRVAALQAGEVHIIQQVPPQMYDTLQADPNIVVKTCAGTRPFWMEMNVHKPPFDDVRVRQAMNYAVNAELLVEKILGGRGIVIPGPLSPYNNFADHTLQPYGYDPEKAKALLAEAGYKPEDISFVIDAKEAYKERAEALAGQFQELGIDATVRLWDYSVLKPLLREGERMAFAGDWGDSAFDPVGHFEAKWHTWDPEGKVNGRGNFSTYSNPRVDELIEMGETEADVAKRHEIYNEAQRIIYEEAPAVFLFLPEEIEACAVKVRNWAPSPDSRINLHDVWLKP
ncbi:MAG TPA: ABC transporter substrate-binding protein, partial [Anaerolineae bacterium]|nr:ABC transporter substrate-binding protein [Anaerolineae bacterium]